MSRSVLLLSASALVAATLMLGACSKSAPSTDAGASASKPSLNSALSPAAVQQAAKAAQAASLPQPDARTPDSAYVEFSNANQLMFLYAAFSGLPADYDKMAKWYSSDYRSASDTFKRHDLLTALQPKLDAGIADAKAHPYVTWIDSNPQIAHYDFNNHSFAVGTVLFQQGGYQQFGNGSGDLYALAPMNGPAFQQLHVTDEAKARAIEAMVANWRTPLRLRIFAFVQSTADDSGIPTVQAVVTRVQLLDPHGQVLLETAAP